jgi:hypothetical protein
MKTKKNPKKTAKTCPACRKIREDSQAYGVGLLLVTALGCGIPGLITIPSMIYLVYRGSRPCTSCRQRKKAQTIG